MGKKIKQNKYQNQNQSTSISSFRKGRGEYEKRLSSEERYQIIFLLVQKIKTLNEVAKQYQRNKETIRSIFKNRLNLKMYWKLEHFLIQNYLNQSKSDLSVDETTIIKNLRNQIDSRQKGQTLDIIIQEINNKRLHSKCKKSERKIEFNSKNRRIIKKIAQHIIYLIPIAGSAAAINNTATQMITEYENYQLEMRFGESSEEEFYQESSTQQHLLNPNPRRMPQAE